ncbi:MAG: DMT family protein [Luteolibacter sp.]
MVGLKTVLLLTLSNVFMTFAWYAHLRDLKDKTWFIAAIISWGIAFFEYMLQVPANRIGSQTFTLPQLKIMQEVITLSVFLPFAVFFMKEKITWNYAGAAVCLAGAVFFIFRK